ncbi:MAG: peptidylprolyl isomerase [Salinivirgaceae bacterium]|jgi:cyclophilin family peptidyl-prolyl cis-trans isomerase|nr:peptidylprolyl isomerase [Salinivirgaceae bacterium]
MKTRISFVILFLIACIFAVAQNDARPKVKIATPYGNMVVELYNETPLHRDNFLKLASEGFYDSLLFHRVIQGFMVQGGDPQSKGAPKGARLGNGGPGYTIEAEFDTAFYHKKGALSAARLGDRANPEKRSSGSQFYIVQGKVLPQPFMEQMEQKANQRQLNTLINNYLRKPENKAYYQRIDSLQRANAFDSVNAMYKKLEEIVVSSDDYDPFFYTPAQKELYSTVGGTPHLDGQYTVFGEVVSGLHVIDSIAAQPTDKTDRPVNDIMMKITVLE